MPDHSEIPFRILPAPSGDGIQAARALPRMRHMSKPDLPRVGEILFEAFAAGASRHGYRPSINSREQGTSWAWALLHHGPSELLIAEVDDRIVGICCLNPRGAHAGVGPVAVDPSFQGYGVGRHLMKGLLQRASGLQSVRLFQEAFNPASLSLYQSFDFVPVAELQDLSLEQKERTKAESSGPIQALSEKDLEELFAYDLERSKLDRRTDLVYYRKWGKVLVCREESRIRGFLACLPGSRSVQLGPLLAEGEEEALSLFRAAIGVFTGRACHTRIMARDVRLASGLTELGFHLYCKNMLMVRGTWRPGRCVEAFGSFPEGV